MIGLQSDLESAAIGCCVALIEHIFAQEVHRFKAALDGGDGFFGGADFIVSIAQTITKRVEQRITHINLYTPHPAYITNSPSLEKVPISEMMNLPRVL